MSLLQYFHEFWAIFHATKIAINAANAAFSAWSAQTAKEWAAIMRQWFALMAAVVGWVQPAQSA